MNYTAQDFWFGKIYPWLDISGKEIKEEKTQNLIKKCKERLSEIAEIMNTSYEEKEITDHGTHISLPTFKIEHEKGKITCRIRFNPCWSYPKRDMKHYSKVWIVLTSDFHLDSIEIKDFFIFLYKEAERVEEKVGKIIYEAVEEELQESNYEISIRNIGVDKLENDLPGLFGGTKDADEVRQTLEKNEKAGEIIKDLLELHYKEKISNPIDKIKTSKEKIHWQVLRSSPVNLLYATELNGGVAKLTGFGNLAGEEGGGELLHSLFKPKVIEMINSL